MLKSILPQPGGLIGFGSEARALVIGQKRADVSLLGVGCFERMRFEVVEGDYG